jgi:hypothetical protein
MKTKVEIPQGYSVERTYDGKFKWESILAPECHACGGFSTYEDAVTHCRMSNNMDEDDIPLEVWRQQATAKEARVVLGDVSPEYQRFIDLHIPNESLKNGEHR